MTGTGRFQPKGRRPLSSDELADLDEQFDECDADGDQRIDFGEFSQLLDSLGSEAPTAQRRARFDQESRDNRPPHSQSAAPITVIRVCSEQDC